MKPVLVVSMLLIAVLGGCTDGAGSRGAAPTGVPKPSPAVSPSGPAGTSQSPSAPTGGGQRPAATGASTMTIELWLTRGGKLFPTKRTRPSTVATTTLSLRELVAGASHTEAAAGVSTALPAGTTFRASVTGGVATVSFPQSFYDGGRTLARLRQAQVVYTLSQFATVKTVGFQRDGEALGAPIGRSGYADLLPAIVVTSLRIGQRVDSPVTIAGTANVFEATVSVRILDASGAQLATGFTMATCGSGCRGRYSTSLAFRVGSVQPGRVQVYEVSAKDGSRVNLVDIPVTLAP